MSECSEHLPKRFCKLLLILYGLSAISSWVDFLAFIVLRFSAFIFYGLYLSACITEHSSSWWATWPMPRPLPQFTSDSPHPPFCFNLLNKPTVKPELVADSPALATDMSGRKPFPPLCALTPDQVLFLALLNDANRIALMNSDVMPRYIYTPPDPHLLDTLTLGDRVWKVQRDVWGKKGQEVGGHTW